MTLLDCANCMTEQKIFESVFWSATVYIPANLVFIWLTISTIGRAVGDRLPEGMMTWKKIMRPAGEKCIPDNQVG